MSDGSGRRAAHFAGQGRGQAQKPSRTGRPQPDGRRQPISRTGAMKMKSANGSGRMSERTAQTTRRAGGHYRQGAPRGRRRGGALRVLPFVLAAVVVVAVLGIVVVPRILGDGRDSGESTVAPGQSVTVNIPEGSGGSAIASILRKAGVISSEDDFFTEVKRQEADSKMKSGTYNFVTGADVAEVVSRLVSGPNSDKGTVTVAEGLTVAKTAAVVEQSLNISSDDFTAQAKASNYSSDYGFLAAAQDDSLEGFLFPKKYDFGDQKDVTADTVIRAMLDQYQKEVASLDFATAEANIKSRYGITMTDYDILKLASIIEKEAVNDDDRPKVASVFYNRMKQGMNLQSDATMSYVTGGEVTADDLKKDSPYNTYLHAGLPPTPICTPSIEAIKAAMAPADTNYLYFLIIENGSYSNHTFSETYEEHQQAIAKAQADQQKSSDGDGQGN